MAQRQHREAGSAHLFERRMQHLLWLSLSVLIIKLVIIAGTGTGAWLGADGENYTGIVEGFWKGGLLAPGLMYWPAGYPLLLWILALPSHAALPWLISITQTLLFSYSVWFFARAVLKTRLDWAALPFAYLALLNPTLSLSSIAIGYESPAAALHILAAGLLILDLRTGEAERRSRYLLWAAVALGVATFMQPRLAVSGIAVLAVWGWTRAGGKARVTAILVPVMVVLAFPGILVARNIAANHVATVSTNLGITMMIGAGPTASGTYEPQWKGVPCDAPSTDPVIHDQQQTKCVISWYLHNPAQVVRLSLAKTAWFWSNWYGPVAKGTMARNPWLRIDPIKAMVTTQASYDLVFGLFGQIVSWAWILGGIAVLLLGVVGTWRMSGLERTLGIALSIIVIASWVISLGTIGDHRFRVPIMTASLFLQVVGWRFLWGRGSLPGIEARPRRLAGDARGEPVPAGSGMSAPKSPRAGAQLSKSARRKRR